MQSGWYDKPLTAAEEQAMKAESSALMRTCPYKAEEGAAALAAFLHPLLEDKLQQLITEHPEDAAALVNDLIAKLKLPARLAEPLTQLIYFFRRSDTRMEQKQLNKLLPRSPLSQHALFMGRGRETMAAALKNELQTADEAWLVVSFVRASAVKLLRADLERFCAIEGHQLYVFTTTYTGATQAAAVKELAALPRTQVFINYDTTKSRMHAKGYIFYRKTGFSTAYIGSSNLSEPALTEGLEWNLKISEYRSPQIFGQLHQAVQVYLSDPRFKLCSGEESFRQLELALTRERVQFGRPDSDFALPDFKALLGPKPLEHQLKILDHLAVQRVGGNKRNLVVAATGTGKTMLAAFDYRNLSDSLGRRPTLLYVAHRTQILNQARETFSRVLNDPNFGELLNGDHKPAAWQQVFATVESLSSFMRQYPGQLEPDHFYMLIVDEVHHGAAQSYQDLFDRKIFNPQYLLGLTATPERMDGKDILPYFNHTISAELRLPEAVNRGLLVPFIYFGISDNIDLKKVHCTRGSYKDSELSDLYTESPLSAERAALAISKVQEIADGEADLLHGLGFCVSVKHARYMADKFNEAGIRSQAVCGDMNEIDRAASIEALEKGELKFLFTVELFNEGVDIPCVNMLLMLRPTESLTIFVQQLGRGLRRDDAHHKQFLTVLDFIGLDSKEFRFGFDTKVRMLLTNPGSLEQEIEQGFPSLPEGCAISLERRAQEAVLENIAKNYCSEKYLLQKYQELQEIRGHEPEYADFLDFYALPPGVLYGNPNKKKPRSFYRLHLQANGIEAGSRVKDHEQDLEYCVNLACMRLRNANDADFLAAFKYFMETGMMLLQLDAARTVDYLKLFYVTLFEQTAPDDEDAILAKLQTVRDIPELCHELCSLLSFRLSHADLAVKPADKQLPLTLYGNYTTDQVLCAAELPSGARRNGVTYSERCAKDIIFVTLDKESRFYSDGTRYADALVDKTHLMWQTPNNQLSDSEAGIQRIAVEKILFLRTAKKESNGNTVLYTCLGPCKCIEHHGSKPVTMKLELEHPIPDRFFDLNSRLAV